MVDKGFMEHVMGLLTPLGDVNSRAMFGGYGIFHEGDMFALISGSNLYFKVNHETRPAYEATGSQRFKPMPYYEVPVEVLEDGERFAEWAEKAIAIGHSTAKKKRL